MKKSKKLLIVGAAVLLCVFVLLLLTVHFWTDSTCTEAAHCKLCRKEGDAALGHDWTAADCLTPKTCATCGETEAEPLGHDWQAATCEKAETCSLCGETRGEKLGHSLVAATCEEAAYCSICGYSVGTPRGHNWWGPTCTDPEICTYCGVEREPSDGHYWIDATADKGRYCPACGSVYGLPLGETQTYPMIFFEFRRVPDGDGKNSLYGARIKAIDGKGDILWEHVTGSYPGTQLGPVGGILQTWDCYYYYEGGKLVALDMEDGTVLWENEGFYGGDAVGYRDWDGRLYVCGYLGPELFVVDSQGKTLHMIETFDDAYAWPVGIKKENGLIIINMALGPNGDTRKDGCLHMVLVDPEDYSYILN